MSELLATEHSQSTCPSWCTSQESNEVHPHVSADVQVETLAQPLTARLVQVAANSEARVMVNGQVATLEQAASFARAVRRLTDEGTPAAGGLDFIFRLAEKHQIPLEDVAVTTGIDIGRLRLYRKGQPSLTVHEVDRLALAVVYMTSSRES